MDVTEKVYMDHTYNMAWIDLKIEIDFTFESKNFLSIFGLYLFSLGTVFCGYSIYLLLEATGRIERSIITWSGQGLFWSLMIFFVALFILFIPVEFLNVFKLIVCQLTEEP